MPGAHVENLQTRRAAQHLTRAELARLAHVSDRCIVTLEAGGTCEPSEAANIDAALRQRDLPTPAVSDPVSETRIGVSDEEGERNNDED